MAMPVPRTIESGKHRDRVAGVGRQDREEGEARGGDRGPERQRQTRTDAIREGARGTRAAGDEDDQREEGRPGRGGRVPARLDQHEGKKEEEGGEGRVEKERQQVRRGERPVAEEAQRDHGMASATFDGDEGRQSRHAREDAAPDARIGPSASRRLDEAEDERAEADRREKGAGQVEPAAFGIAGFGNSSERDPEQHGGDRQVDEKHRSPREGLDEPSAEGRADGAAQGCQGRPGAHGLSPLACRKRRAEHREAGGDEEGRADPLEAASGDERGRAGGQAACEGCGGEHDDAEQEDLPAAEAIGEGPAHEHERREKEGVRLDDPLCRARPKSGADSGARAATR